MLGDFRVIKDIWPVGLLVPGGEAGAGAHSRRQVDGREQTKENKLPPEEGGVSRRGKMEKGGSERNRSILEELPVITILSFFFFPFFFSTSKPIGLVFVTFTTKWSFSVLLADRDGLFMKYVGFFSGCLMWERLRQSRERENACGSSPGSAGSEREREAGTELSQGLFPSKAYKHTHSDFHPCEDWHKFPLTRTLPLPDSNHNLKTRV